MRRRKAEIQVSQAAYLALAQRTQLQGKAVVRTRYMDRVMSE